MVKLITCYFLKIMNVSNYLSLLQENKLELIIYSILITKINQLDLRSNLCDYSDVYILVKGTITVTGNHPRNRQNRPLILKNNAPFISCKSKINN